MAVYARWTDVPGVSQMIDVFFGIIGGCFALTSIAVTAVGLRLAWHAWKDWR